MNESNTGNGVLLSARGLVKHFENGNVRAVDGLDLDIMRQEFVAICGPSGCGKSTLLNLIAAIDRPDRGTLTVAGRSLASLDRRDADAYRRDTVGLVFQLHNLLASLTALENVQVPMMAAATSAAARCERAPALLESVGLLDRADALPSVLSGGERQRVALARALANEPEILLADEPTGALDSESGQRLLNLLEDLRRQSHMTLIVVTHDEKVARRADRILHMLDGRIEA